LALGALGLAGGCTTSGCGGGCGGLGIGNGQLLSRLGFYQNPPVYDSGFVGGSPTCSTCSNGPVVEDPSLPAGALPPGALPPGGLPMPQRITPAPPLAQPGPAGPSSLLKEKNGAN
jgi:hypothetical protein